MRPYEAPAIDAVPRPDRPFGLRRARGRATRLWRQWAFRAEHARTPGRSWALGVPALLASHTRSGGLHAGLHARRQSEPALSLAHQSGRVLRRERGGLRVHLPAQRRQRLFQRLRRRSELGHARAVSVTRHAARSLAVVGLRFGFGWRGFGFGLTAQAPESFANRLFQALLCRFVEARARDLVR